VQGRHHTCRRARYYRCVHLCRRRVYNRHSKVYYQRLHTAAAAGSAPQQDVGRLHVLVQNATMVQARQRARHLRHYLAHRLQRQRWRQVDSTSSPPPPRTSAGTGTSAALPTAGTLPTTAIAVTAAIITIAAISITAAHICRRSGCQPVRARGGNDVRQVRVAAVSDNVRAAVVHKRAAQVRQPRRVAATRRRRRTVTTLAVAATIAAATQRTQLRQELGRQSWDGAAAARAGVHKQALDCHAGAGR